MISDKLHKCLDQMEKIRFDDEGDAPYTLVYNWVQQKILSFSEFSELMRVFVRIR